MQLTQEDQKKLMEIITPFVKGKSSLKELTRDQLTKAIDQNITKMTNSFNEKFTKNGKVLKQYQYKKDNYKRAKQKLDQAKRLVINRPPGVSVKQILSKKGNTQILDYLGNGMLPPGGPGSLLNYNFPDADSPNNVPEYKKIALAIKFLQKMVQKQQQAPAQPAQGQSVAQAPPPPPPQEPKPSQENSAQLIQKQIKKINQKYNELLDNSKHLHPNELNKILQKILEGLKNQTTKQRYTELLKPTLDSLRKEISSNENDIPTLTQREKKIKDILQTIELVQKQRLKKIEEKQTAAAQAAKEAKQAAQRAQQQARIKADQQSKRIAAEAEQQAKRLQKIAQQEKKAREEAEQEQRIKLAKQAEDKAKLEAQQKAKKIDQLKKAADDACKQCQIKKGLILEDGVQQQQQQQQQQQEILLDGGQLGGSAQVPQSSKGIVLGGQQQQQQQQQQHQFAITNGQLNIINKSFNPDQLVKKVGQAPNLSQLKTIYLSGNKLGNQGLKKIIPVLSKANSLQKLSIQNNDISNQGAIKLANDGYPGLKALKSLSVANNKIGPVGADALIRRLKFNQDYSPNLTQINFSNNETEQGKSLKSQFDNINTNLASMLRVLTQRTPERNNINVTY